MSPKAETTGTHVLDWSLTIGGIFGLILGVIVFLKSQQAPIPRSFTFLISVFIAAMGIGNLLEPRHPEWSSRFKFAGKVFAGFAIFSLSWALSHP
jgi:hypothetical protein